MNRNLILMGLLLFASVHLWAQQKVTGKISDGQEPLIGVNIIEVSTGKGTVSDIEGNYSIEVPADATLRFSMVGFGNKEIKVDGRSTIDVIMEQGVELNAVMVTALGISREKKTLGYAAQDVNGEELTNARETNVVNSLAGKVSGVQINRAGSGLGSSSRVVIRGNTSISGTNQPLYVVDGVPIDNTSPGQTGEFGGYDAGDGISNINPDDIESMSVLKGPNAAALYGSRASNGVIVITTKKGVAGKRLGIDFNSNFSVENPMVYPKVQKTYAPGSNGTTQEGTIENWGAKLGKDPDDLVGEFLQPGTSFTNSLGISSSSEKNNMRFSMTHLNGRGIIPNSSLERYNLMLRNETKLGEKITFDAKINYINQAVDNRNRGGEDASAWTGVVNIPAGVTNDQLKKYIKHDEKGNELHNFIDNRGIYLNPYWVANRISRDDKRNRIIALGSLKYDFNENLSLMARTGIDTYADENDYKVFAGSPTTLTSNSPNGDFQQQFNSSKELNMDFLLNYNKKLNTDLSLNASAGGNIRKNQFKTETFGAGGLDLPNVFSLTNALNPQALPSNLFSSSGAGGVAQLPILSRKEIHSLYAFAQIGFKEYLFMDITTRNDWASTLPIDNNSYFYPSLSVSAILSDMLGSVPSFLTFAKLRGSVAQVANDVSPFLNAEYLTVVNAVGGIGLSNGPILPEFNLKPEITTSLELGGDFRLFDNRVGIDFTYYKSNSKNQLIFIPIRPSSGYLNKAINAGNIQNSGLELLISGIPYKRVNSSWEVGVNLSSNKNLVKELHEDVKTFTLSNNRVAQIVAEEGGSLGDIYVVGYERNNNGEIIVDANGLPKKTGGFDVKVGNIAPKLMGGITNELTVKNLSLNFLIDFRVGGKVVSHTQAVLAYQGISKETLDGREGIIVDGVDENGQKNTIKVPGETYWKYIGGRGGPIGEAFAYDANNIRLRQVGLTYSLPSKLVDKTPFERINLSAFGRNLFFIYKDAPFDPEVSLGSSLTSQGVDFWSLPTLRSFGVDLKVSL